jgi:hypothetical protein
MYDSDSWIDKVMEFIGLRVFPIMAMVILLGVFIGIPVAFFMETRNPKLELNKSEWDCTKYVDVEHTAYIKVGGMLTPHTTISAECVNYERKMK